MWQEVIATSLRLSTSAMRRWLKRVNGQINLIGLTFGKLPTRRPHESQLLGSPRVGNASSSLLQSSQKCVEPAIYNYIYYIIICFSLLPVTLTDWTSKTRSFVWRCLVHACLPGLQKDLHHWMALHQQRSQQPRSGETEASTWRILRAGKQFDPRVVPQPRFFFPKFTLWLWLTVCHGKIHHF